VLVIDDTGDRKDGSATAHVARQYLGSVGKIDNGIVAVTSLWADARCYWPVHAVPYTPASRLPGGERDPAFRTKPQLAVELVQAAKQAGIPFRAVVADCAYGDNPGFTDTLTAAKVPFVLALKPRKGTWAPADQAHTPVEAAGELGWHGPTKPGRWRRVTRRFRDGHTETWWAADAQLSGWGPDRPLRLVVASIDPGRLPGHSTWYLLTNLPRPTSRRAQPTDLAEVVRLYGLRNWVEQSYKLVKGELGWADFQVRSDRAIRRHWALVCCAFSFCWQAFLAEQPPAPESQAAPTAARGAQATGHPGGTGRAAVVASGAAPGAGLVDPMEHVATLLAVMVASTAAPAAATAA
jgi:DDE superfamily endonuclease